MNFLYLADNPIWRILRQPCSPHEWQVETGQLLISKLARGGLNLAALMIAEEMNVAHEFWYSMSGGDKDTFVSLSLSPLILISLLIHTTLV